mgnify:CR=1 FL=1
MAWVAPSARSGGSPLLDLRALTHRNFALSMAIMCVAMMAMMGAMILLPLWLQDARGLSVLQAGLVVTDSHTGEVIALAPLSAPEDVDRAVAGDGAPILR